MRKIDIFISSAMRELECEREIAQEVLREMNVNPILFELFPGLSHSPAEAYSDEVQQCDIFILILWKSLRPAVREEYREAVKRSKPILVLVKSLTENEERDPELRDFLRGLAGSDSAQRGVRLVFKSFRGLSELRAAVRDAVSAEIAKFYREPVQTFGREEMYQLGTSIIQHSQRRLHVYQNTPSLLFGARDYLAPEGRKLAYEKEFLDSLEAWIERNYRNADSEFTCLFSLDATRKELTDQHLMTNVDYLASVSERVRRCKDIEAQSGYRFRISLVHAPVSGPLIVGDSRFAIWLSGGTDAVAISQQNEKISDILVRMVRGHTREQLTASQMLAMLGLTL